MENRKPFSRTEMTRNRRLPSTRRASDRRDTHGFTLVELLVVVAVIGIISSIAIPAFRSRVIKSRIAKVAADIKGFEEGFVAFAVDTGEFPPDSHLPPPNHLKNGVGIENYLTLSAWVPETPLGGNYNWEGPDYYPYAGISLYKTTASAATLAELDEVVDDGDLLTGKFRFTANGRYTYIISE